MGNARAYSEHDVGNIVEMEHVNVTIPDQAKATLFYVIGLGFTRDPYMNVDLGNMWINVGKQQFHLPTREPQVIPGHIGLVVPSLERLRERLQAVQDRLAGTAFTWSDQDGYVLATCPWGNQFRCYAPDPRFGNMVLGIPYVEFAVKPGAAEGVGRFYSEVMGAPAVVDTNGGGPAARVNAGCNQILVFRETADAVRPYDGHHIAVYVANFSGPYAFCKEHELVTEDVTNSQFRFKDLVDPRTAKPVFELEHEVRSMYHKMYRRPFVNRNPDQSQRAYAPGRDAFVP